MSNELLNLTANDFVTMYDSLFTKKKAEEAGVNLVSSIFESGEVNEIAIYTNLVRLKAVIESADKAFRERLKLNAAETYNGVSLTPKNGAEKLHYSEDHEVAELEEKLKQRKELVKVATKSKEPIFDENGVEVTKVSSKFDKSSITVSF